MIPLLPSWDENDNMSAPYVGPIKRPAPKGEWENATFSLGPLNYGVPEQHLAQRWWAIYSEIHEGVTYIYIVPANLDGSGWGRPRRILDFYYARIIIGITFGFNHRGLAIIGLHHNDNYGPPNATSVFYPVKDSAGAYEVRIMYLMDAKGVVIACEKPEYVEGVERVTYLFYKDPNNVLTYLTDNGTENWSNANAVKSRELGPSWEIMHGGYRIDGKFQLAYRHDANDPLPPDVLPPESYTYGELLSSPYPYKAPVETNPIPKASVSTATVTTVTPTVETASVAKPMGTITGILITEPLINLPVVEQIPVAKAKIDSMSVENTILVTPVTETLPTTLPLAMGVKLTTTRVGDEAVSTTTIGVPTISNITVTNL